MRLAELLQSAPAAISAIPAIQRRTESAEPLPNSENSKNSNPAEEKTEREATGHPVDWHAARDACHRHHFNCRQCSAAGGGHGTRCAAGAELWAAYQAAPVPDRREQAAHEQLRKLQPTEHDARAWAVWTPQEVATFSDRVARFKQLGAPDPETTAERLLWRDRDDDGRVLCLECAHYRAGRCWNRSAAGLNHAALGDLATTLQRCPGFRAHGASEHDH